MPRIATIGFAFVAGTVMLVSACARQNELATARRDGWNYYGMTDDDSGSKVALGALAGGESDVVIEGKIESVCPKKGCWMRVVDGDDTVFVRFRDYSFFVPMNAAGRSVVAHGNAVASVASVEELRHYAEDAGQSAEEIAKITEPETRITFYADSVSIAGAGLDEPHHE